MSRSLTARVALGFILALGVAACSREGSTRVAPTSKGTEPQQTDPGQPLFKPDPWQKTDKNGAIQADPIVLPQCHLTLIDKQDVPSQLDGVIAFIGLEVPQGEKADPRDLWEHPRTKKLYRKLKPGNKVTKRQDIILLDDVNAELELRTAEAGLKIAEADVVAAEKTIGHVKGLLDIEVDARNKGVGTLAQMRAAEANVARYESEKVSKLAGVEKARGELDRARLRLRYHTIGSTIAGEVVAINKELGESIRANETILQIQNHDRLRVEGFVATEQASRVQKGMDVSIEPTIHRGPTQTLSFHKALPITALAVSNHTQRPLILSGGQDGSVNVWDRSQVLKTWSHKGTVRAIACTGTRTKESLAVTGAEDGIAKLWDLNRVSDTPLRELNERRDNESHVIRHAGGVTAAAFSPNGEFLVTADGERNIYLWKTSTGERVYSFPQVHAAPVSALHFIPQCRVISVGRDNIVHVWQVGQNAARAERSFEHRSGDVTQLGVTEDGNWMALDHDKTRLHITPVERGVAERVLNSLTDSTHFGPFAIFSPKLNLEGNRLVLTASNQGRVLQLWRHAPTEDRSHELVQLVPEKSVPATVAAFSPSIENGFIVVGTDRGDVHLWAMPTETEINRKWTARVSYVENAVDPTARQVKVWAEFENDPPGPTRLKPGSTAAVVIRPAK